MSDNKACLVLTRDVAANGVLFAYRVELDGVRVGKVRAGKESVFDLEPGDHSLVVGLEMTQSEPFAFHVQAGDVVRLSCGPRFSFLDSLSKAFTDRRRFLAVYPL